MLFTSSFAQFGTPATPAVSPTGAFTLEVPIRIPPGTAGVAPKISLVYSSQSGNGIAGAGWNLSGLSTIMRCPKTKAVDNERGGVNLNSNDRLCLDGQRLILQSGTYGSPGAIYYTELFGGARVVQVFDQLTRFSAQRGSSTSGTMVYAASGTARIQSATSTQATTKHSGASNVAFRVQTKAGEVMEYASAEIDSNWITRMWLLVRVIDVKGNYWSVDYEKNSVIGEYRPKVIQYTGHEMTPVTLPYNRVEFFYAPRPDPTVAFLGGARVSNTQRLTNIKTYSHGTEVTDYRLTYFAGTSGVTFRSLLASIQECTPASGCQQPVAFTYSGTTPQNFIGAAWQSHGGLYWDSQRQTYVNNFVGDFNGDGKSDMAAFRSVGGEWHISLSTGTGFTQHIWHGHGGGVHNNFLGDFNGDGKTDLAAYSSGAGWHVSLSTGSNFAAGPFWTCHSGGYENVLSGDFNGDGRTDLAIHTGGGGWQMCLSNGSGFDNYLWPNAHGGLRNNTLVGDFNGDGLTDLAAYNGSTPGQWHMCLSTGVGWACNWWYGHGEGIAGKNFLGDFNGDGKTDTMAFDLGTRQWNMCLSTGTAFNCSLWAGVGDADNQITGDFNGDGRTDAGAYTGANGLWHVCYSAGDRFNCVYQQATGDVVDNAFIGDYNGDGLADIAGYTNANGIWEVRLANMGGYPDLLTSLQSSQTAGVGPTGVQTTVTYAPLGATDRYIKEFGVNYPQSVVSTPLYVVTALASDNAVGGTNRVDYWYGTALADANGRGLLGFNWQESVDQQSGIVSRTTFRQDWPFIGMPSLQQTWRPGKSHLLRRSTNTWAVKTLTAQEPLTAASCSAGATAGRPVLLVSSPFDESWDINPSATPMPKTKTINEIDCFGNATRVQIDTHHGDGTFSGFRKVTANVIENWVDSNRWLLNRLKESRVTSSIPTGQPFGATANPVPTVTLTAPATGSSFNALATINLTANASDSNGIARVDFYNGSTVIGSDTTAPYSFSWAGVNTGTYTLRARAHDSLGAFADSSSVSVTVNNAAPSITLTAPGTGATYTVPASLTLQASASDPNDGVNRVQFYRNGGHIGTATSPPYNFPWYETAPGTHSFVALAVDNAGAQTWSNTAYVTFTAPPLSIGVSPTYASGSAPAYNIARAYASVSVAGGVGPYNFSWTMLSGYGIGASGGQNVEFFGEVGIQSNCPTWDPQGQLSALFQVTVTDGAGQVQTAMVNVYLYSTTSVYYPECW